MFCSNNFCLMTSGTIIFVLHSCGGNQNAREIAGSKIYFHPERESPPKWTRSTPIQKNVFYRRRSLPTNAHLIITRSREDTEGRHFAPETIVKISETLGALNTVGNYLVNMTRGENTYLSDDVPSAIYTISKNFLGRNVTDTIAPLVREALPVVQVNTDRDGTSVIQTTTEINDVRTCVTPDGITG